MIVLYDKHENACNWHFPAVTDMDGLGARIKTAADVVGGLDRLAELIPTMSRRSLSDYVNSKSEPRAALIGEIAKATGVSAGWLLLGEGEMLPSLPFMPLHKTFDRLGAHADGRDRSRPSGPDVHRLTVAIEAVEDGLSGRQLPAAVKAELILVAYELLTEATPENRARIMRLVKGA